MSSRLDKIPDTGKLLVKFEGNWADEIDLEGGMIWDAAEFKENMKLLKASKDWPKSLYVGTNEDIEYSSFSRVLSDLSWKPITDAEEAIIIRLIGTEYGFSKWVYLFEEDETDDDDDDEY